MLILEDAIIVPFFGSVFPRCQALDQTQDLHQTTVIQQVGRC
jgi:hypothetical protein